MSKKLISRLEARKRVHAQGLSIAASRELVEGLPKYTDGKRKKVREVDLESRIEELLAPAPLPRKGIISDRSWRALTGR